ncbi:MAG: hypothetical protein HQM08_11165 [Candidatus Riflebacteria bacterium]|nr:hypothetical protein [Candidatus Riflebacteria bacterium]
MQHKNHFWVVVYFFLAISSAVSACAGGDPVSIQGGKMVVATVDVSAILAFHPAMRSFDYHQGKFITRIPARPTSANLSTWEQSSDERRRIVALEESMEKQCERLNSELMACFNKNKEKNKPGNTSTNTNVSTDSHSNSPAASNTENNTDAHNKIATNTNIISDIKENSPEKEPETSIEVEKERERLISLNKQHKEILEKLATKMLGEFPESAFGDLKQDDLKRILGEINWAIGVSAKSHGAAFVLNTSDSIANSSNRNSEKIENAKPEEDILKKFNIIRLSDLEEFIKQASGTNPLPLGKNLPPQDKTKPCGGHFESITDPAYLKTLSGEFYDNRQVFQKPFFKLGVTRHVWEGTMGVTEIDLTFEVLGQIFNLYKTRQLEREAAYSIIRERLGR